MSALAEGRSSRRSHTRMPCTILPGQLGVHIPGLIYNLSQTGAAIEVNVFGKLPGVIGVEVNGKIYQAKVVWRKAKHIGVHFVSET